MHSLNDREWDAFLLTDVFVIRPGKRLTKSDMKAGKRPFIGATEYGNGITNWVSNTNVSLDSEVLGVNYNGSVVETFYHPYECIFSDDVKRFRLKDCHGNRLVYLFLKTTIVQQKSKYAYGYKFNEERMNKQSILLPVDEQGKPDWAFMEEYIREREENLAEEYRQCVLPPRNQADWREFELCEIFPIIQRGKRLKTADHIKGDTPYVSSSAMNNGVDNFVANRDGVRAFCNCITIANSGSVGQAFFHPYNFVASDHVTQLKNDGLTRHMYMFLLPIVSQLSEKYNFNHEINDVRIRREKIMLPATADGEPDWAYMEQYIREQEDKLIQEYREYIGKYYHERDLAKNWKEFELSKVFAIRATSSSIDKNRLVGSGGVYPYVTRSDANNGINDWIAAQPAYAMDKGNCITVGLDTQTAFYQPAPFYTGQNIQVFTSDRLNADNAQFLVPCIKNAMSMFSWGGNGATLTRLRRSKIMLPADDNGEPDWAYMEEYGQAIQARQVFAYLDYLVQRA